MGKTLFRNHQRLLELPDGLVALDKEIAHQDLLVPVLG
jgi:hypothetical protein